MGRSAMMGVQYGTQEGAGEEFSVETCRRPQAGEREGESVGNQDVTRKRKGQGAAAKKWGVPHKEGRGESHWVKESRDRS